MVFFLMFCSESHSRKGRVSSGSIVSQASTASSSAPNPRPARSRIVAPSFVFRRPESGDSVGRSLRKVFLTGFSTLRSRDTKKLKYSLIQNVAIWPLQFVREINRSCRYVSGWLRRMAVHQFVLHEPPCRSHCELFECAVEFLSDLVIDSTRIGHV